MGDSTSGTPRANDRMVLAVADGAFRSPAGVDAQTQTMTDPIECQEQGGKEPIIHPRHRFGPPDGEMDLLYLDWVYFAISTFTSDRCCKVLEGQVWKEKAGKGFGRYTRIPLMQRKRLAALANVKIFVLSPPPAKQFGQPLAAAPMEAFERAVMCNKNEAT